MIERVIISVEVLRGSSSWKVSSFVAFLNVYRVLAGT